MKRAIIRDKIFRFGLLFSFFLLTLQIFTSCASGSNGIIKPNSATTGQLPNTTSTIVTTLTQTHSLITTTKSTTTRVDNSIKSGMYKAGKDIQIGDYILFSSSGNQSYFQITKDSSGSFDSIIMNDVFVGDRYITISDGQYIEFDNATMLPINEAPVLQPTNGKYLAGMYKVGRDITEGEYEVIADGGNAYLEVDSDLSGSIDSIITNDNFTNQEYITIVDGQYIKLNGCYIAH